MIGQIMFSSHSAGDWSWKKARRCFCCSPLLSDHSLSLDSKFPCFFSRILDRCEMHQKDSVFCLCFALAPCISLCITWHTVAYDKFIFFL